MTQKPTGVYETKSEVFEAYERTERYQEVLCGLINASCQCGWVD